MPGPQFEKNLLAGYGTPFSGRTEGSGGAPLRKSSRHSSAPPLTHGSFGSLASVPEHRTLTDEGRSEGDSVSLHDAHRRTQSYPTPRRGEGFAARDTAASADAPQITCQEIKNIRLVQRCSAEKAFARMFGDRHAAVVAVSKFKPVMREMQQRAETIVREHLYYQSLDKAARSRLLYDIKSSIGLRPFVDEHGGDRLTQMVHTLVRGGAGTSEYDAGAFRKEIDQLIALKRPIKYKRSPLALFSSQTSALVSPTRSAPVEPFSHAEHDPAGRRRRSTTLV